MCYTFGSDHIAQFANNATALDDAEEDTKLAWLTRFLTHLPNWLIAILGLELPDHDLHRQKFMKHHGALNRTKKRGPQFGLSIILDVKQDDYFFDPTGSNLDAGVKFRVHPSYRVVFLKCYLLG